MTTVDKEVTSRQLIMVMPRKHIEKRVKLKEEYRYARYKDAFREQWANLQYSVGLFDSIETAKAAIDSFLKDKEQFEQNFLFVTNFDDELVGSAGLWPGRHFGDSRLRLHYVAVREDCQHQGIATSMITHLCKQYDSIPSKYPLYLVTQTNSYGAIALYSHIGFTPYLGAYEGCTKDKSEKNWEIATNILREKASG